MKIVRIPGSRIAPATHPTRIMVVMTEDEADELAEILVTAKVHSLQSIREVAPLEAQDTDVLLSNIELLADTQRVADAADRWLIKLAQ